MLAPVTTGDHHARVGIGLVGGVIKCRCRDFPHINHIAATGKQCLHQRSAEFFAAPTGVVCHHQRLNPALATHDGNGLSYAFNQLIGQFGSHVPADTCRPEDVVRKIIAGCDRGLCLFIR